MRKESALIGKQLEEREELAAEIERAVAEYKHHRKEMVASEAVAGSEAVSVAADEETQVALLDAERKVKTFIAHTEDLRLTLDTNRLRNLLKQMEREDFNRCVSVRRRLFLSSSGLFSS